MQGSAKITVIKVCQDQGQTFKEEENKGDEVLDLTKGIVISNPDSKRVKYSQKSEYMSKMSGPSKFSNMSAYNIKVFGQKTDPIKEESKS
jgi:hypothetical protein